MQCAEDIVGKIRRLEQEKQNLAKQNELQQKTLIHLERRLARFEEIKEQRDWLLDEMTQKIGDLSRFQSELFKSERLSAIGEISARIAHDMRNPLTIIKNTVELLRIKHSAKIPTDLLDLFATIDDASSRLAFQLDDVLNFVRSSPLSCKECSLLETLESALEKIIIPDEIKIELPANDAYLFCDGEKIEAVFTNLIMNAIQAMENNGTVSISFEECDDAITFSVEDSGPGIPQDKIEKIFEPLYTTKSRGTGLGLPAVRTIVTQHLGSISVSNGPTVFSVTLPKKI
jgi:signal transduction histidine kinase